ncbi:hypothetical protein Tco_0154154 [Tanacetum coccineum]
MGKILESCCLVLTTWHACHPSLILCLSLLRESLPSVPYISAIAVPGYWSRMHTYDHGGSEAHDELPDSILSIELSPTSYLEPRAKARPLARWLLGLENIIPTVNRWWVGHPDDGSNGDGTGGGDECTDIAVHLVRCSLAECGDSEVSGDGGGVGMARSLSTSASGRRDMEA